LETVVIENKMMDISKRRQLAGFLGWFSTCFATAAIGGLASASAGAFYQQLNRPEWAPPGWLFAPVWTLLYLLMAISAWLVWRARGFKAARDALSLFLLQLAVNAAWTPLFFVWHLGAAAFVEILVLWILIACTVVVFWHTHRLAAVLLLPYLAWVTFASGLTYTIWQLNPALLA
jgi:tryptophan-rich sensory protein